MIVITRTGNFFEKIIKQLHCHGYQGMQPELDGEEVDFLKAAGIINDTHTDHSHVVDSQN